jgi:protein involved in polysaccharide export with SLBB domain
MLVEGAIRTEQRQQNVRLYKERDDKEEKVNELIRQRAKKQNDLSSDDDEGYDFIRPMMKQIVDDPSLKRRDLKHHHHKRR